jgi:YVTN family beta-propeller protein
MGGLVRLEFRPVFAAATAVATAALAVGLAATPAQASAITTGETSTALPFANIAGMVVASSGGHIFVTGGLQTTYIDVLNLDGTADTTIAADDANGMALSADGSTLYVAVTKQDEVLAINTSTLSVTATYSTGSGSEPFGLALSGGELWLSLQSGSGIDRIDPSSGTVTSTGVQSISYDAGLKATATAPDVLVMASATSPQEVSVYNVASGEPVYVTGSSSSFCGGDVTLTATDVVVSCGGTLTATAYNLTNFAVDATYTVPLTEGIIINAEVTPSGQVALGAFNLTDNGSVSVYYFSGDSSSPVSNYGDWANDDSIGSMGWSADGSVSYYTVAGGETYSLETVRPLSTVNLDFPTAGVRDETLTGSVSSGSTASYTGTVTVTKTDFVGNVAVIPIAADGSFSFADDDVLLGNPTDYTVQYSGDDEHTAATATATVQYIPPAYPLGGGGRTALKAPVASAPSTTGGSAKSSSSSVGTSVEGPLLGTSSSGDVFSTTSGVGAAGGTVVRAAAIGGQALQPGTTSSADGIRVTDFTGRTVADVSTPNSATVISPYRLWPASIVVVLFAAVFIGRRRTSK